MGIATPIAGVLTGATAVLAVYLILEASDPIVTIHAQEN